jgi:hypothetical protein
MIFRGKTGKRHSGALLFARKKNPPRPWWPGRFCFDCLLTVYSYASVSIALLKVALGRMTADTFASSSL